MEFDEIDTCWILDETKLAVERVLPRMEAATASAEDGVTFS
jgi:hypothetical protein